jgi:hypothetical protein
MNDFNLDLFKMSDLDFFVMTCNEKAIELKSEVIEIIKHQIQNDLIMFCGALLIINIYLYYKYKDFMIILSSLLIVTFFVYVRFFL